MQNANEDLARRLEQRTTELSRRCIEAMYRDPFWQARFGDRGRRHAEEDSAYHVKYVVAALRAGDRAVFENYTIWLRGVLASRGMCSWHLAESFRQLTLALGAEQIMGAEPAAELLAVGGHALEYHAGPAAPLTAHAQELKARVEQQLGGEGYRLDELLSFVQDGLSRGDSSALPRHVAFLQSTLSSEPLERAQLHDTLSALFDAAAAWLAPGDAASLRTTLEACREAS